ncbi:MAG: Lrp/AsnC family transcriptional regulator [Chloroflexota bacterium]
MIDDRDYAIILELQEDARQSDARIARKTGISEASVRRRISRMIRDGVIRIAAVTSPWKTGYNVPAFIGICVELSRLEQVLKALTAMPRVHFIGTVAGRYDIVIWATFRSPQELAEFGKKDLAAVRGITRTEAMITLEITKREQKILSDNRSATGTGDRQTGPVEALGAEAADPSPEAFDERDYRLMVELQRDARQSDAQVSRKLGISEATVRRRIHRLIQRGIISIAPVITPYAVGYSTAAFIVLRCRLSSLDEVLERLSAMPRVHFVSLVTGRFDVLAWGTFRSPRELTKFIKRDLSALPGVVSSETFINLEICKRDLGLLPPRPAEHTEASRTSA